MSLACCPGASAIRVWLAPRRTGAITELKPPKRAFTAFLKAFEKGLLIRTTGDIIALSPPLIIGKAEIDELFGTLTEVLKALD